MRRKPRLGQKIYVVYRGQITQETVGWLGKDSWIPEGFQDYYEECQVYPYEYDTLNPDVYWFTTLKEAKEKLLKQEPYCKKIKKIKDWLWEVE